MKIAIRDDDLCALTNYEEVKQLYSFLDGPVSYSVVPVAFPVHKQSVYPYGDDIEIKYYDIFDNMDLCTQLLKDYKDGEIDLMLHGITHEYKKKNGKWIPELGWKSKKMLVMEIEDNVDRLRDYFGKDSFSVFVPPNNFITSKCIGIIEKCNMNISGQIRFINRPLSLQMVKNSIQRQITRLKYGFPTGKKMKYPHHCEILAYPVDNFEKMVKEYNYCKKNDCCFVLYTHYWHLMRNNDSLSLLKKIVKYCIDDGAHIVKLSDCFRSE